MAIVDPSDLFEAFPLLKEGPVRPRREFTVATGPCYFCSGVDQGTHSVTFSKHRYQQGSDDGALDDVFYAYDNRSIMTIVK